MDLSNSIVFDIQFKKAFSKLLKMEHPAPTALKLFKVSKVIDEQATDVISVRNSLLERFCEMDDGRPKYENDLPVFKSDEDKSAFLEEMNSLLSTTFEVDIPKIKLPESAMVSAQDIVALESILDIE